MALIYASTADLSAWTGTTAPANATQLLRSASLLVRQATSMAFYAADTVTGLPTDAIYLQSFNDATCAQAAFWAANNIDPTTGGLATAAPIRGRKIGSAVLDYDTTLASSVTAFNARVFAARTLCEEARQILQQSKINTTAPWIAG